MADSIESILLKHRIYLQRLIPSLSTDVIKEIDKNNPELRGELVDWLDKNQDNNLVTVNQQKQLDVLRNKVLKIRGGSISDASKMYQGDMFELAQKEQLFLANGLNTITGLAIAQSSATALGKMVERQPFVGQTIQEMYQSLSLKDAERIMTEVKSGLANGLTKQQIQNAIFGTKALNYTDGVLQTTRNTVNSSRTNSGIVRTTINGVTNESHQMLYQQNSDIIEFEEFVATLDGKTSAICQSLDGKVYKLGEGPIPPLHINCRSQRVPIIKGFEDISTERPFVRDTRTRKERERDFRREAREEGVTIGEVRRKWANRSVGQVSSKTNYSEWLKNQPATFQKDVLGKTKYELFKNGTPLTAFVDESGKAYNLDQLYAKEKGAFEKAGLDKP